VLEYFKSTFDRVVPSIEWKKSEVIELSGKQWVLMEMTSSAVDTDIHNIMLVTGVEKEMLIFNFNSTKEDFKLHEALLRESVDSIRVVASTE